MADHDSDTGGKKTKRAQQKLGGRRAQWSRKRAKQTKALKLQPSELLSQPGIKGRFIARLVYHDGDVAATCAELKQEPVEVYSWREDAVFDAHWRAAKKLVRAMRLDRVEKVTADRAEKGTEYTKYDPKGNVIETGVTPDTPAARMILEAYEPETFAKKSDAGDGMRTLADLFRGLDAAQAAGLIPQTRIVTHQLHEPVEQPGAEPITVKVLIERAQK